MIKNESKKKMLHIQLWTSDWNLLTVKNYKVTWLWNCLGFVALIKTNIFGFWIKWFGVEMRKLWLKQDTKNSWRILHIHSFSIFFKLCLEGREIFLKERVRKNGQPIKTCHVTSMCGLHVAHVGKGLCWPCVTRGSHMDTIAWPFAKQTPLAFFSRIRAFELRFRICFRITNHDSLTHNDDYKTLTKGW